MSLTDELVQVAAEFAEVDGQDKLRLLLEYADELPELPEPDAALVTRAVHRWRFESLGAA